MVFSHVANYLLVMSQDAADQSLGLWFGLCRWAERVGWTARTVGSFGRTCISVQGCCDVVFMHIYDMYIYVYVHIYICICIYIYSCTSCNYIQTTYYNVAAASSCAKSRTTVQKRLRWWSDVVLGGRWRVGTGLFQLEDTGSWPRCGLKKMGFPLKKKKRLWMDSFP